MHAVAEWTRGVASRRSRLAALLLHASLSATAVAARADAVLGRLAPRIGLAAVDVGHVAELAASRAVPRALRDGDAALLLYPPAKGAPLFVLLDDAGVDGLVPLVDGLVRRMPWRPLADELAEELLLACEYVCVVLVHEDGDADEDEARRMERQVALEHESKRLGMAHVPVPWYAALRGNLPDALRPAADQGIIAVADGRVVDLSSGDGVDRALLDTLIIAAGLEDHMARVGLRQLQRGQHEAAVETLTRLLAARPNHVLARFHRASALDEIDPIGALEDIARVRQLAPAHPTAAALHRRLEVSAAAYLWRQLKTGESSSSLAARYASASAVTTFLARHAFWPTVYRAEQQGKPLPSLVRHALHHARFLPTMSDTGSNASSRSSSPVSELAPPKPLRPPQFNARRRGSVSAEVLGGFADAQQPPVVHEKTDEARERIQRATAKNFLFAGLEAAQKKELADAMFEVVKEKGDVIIKQGADGDNFYVVESGSCEVFIQSGDGAEKKVAVVTAGGSFGELALMYNTPRAATVVAAEAVKLWGLDRVSFRKILLISTLNRRKKFETFLAKVPLLQSLSVAERATVSDSLATETYQDGEVVVRQGERGEDFYIVEEGQAVTTVQESHDAPAVEVKRQLPGDYFGELALVNDAPRAATVTAVGTLRVQKMDRGAFTRLLGPCQDILKRNMEQYNQLTRTITIKEQVGDDGDDEDDEPAAPVRPVRRRGGVSAESFRADKVVALPPAVPKTDDQKARIRAAIVHNAMFSNIGQDQAAAVIDVMFEVRKNDGDVIIQQGDEGDYFYVLDAGECEFFIKGDDGADKFVGSASVGGSFGELALLYNCPRAATVKAKGDNVILWAVDGQSFRAIIASTALARRKLFESFLEKVPILESLTKYERSTVADALVDETHEDGTAIVKQGDTGDKFFIIESGAAIVTMSPSYDVPPVEVKRLGVGDYFGEIALITDSKRAANVIAVGQVRVVVLDRRSFQRILGSVEDVLKRNMSNYQSYSEVVSQQA